MEKKNLKNYEDVTTEEIIKMFASAEYGEMTILSQLYEDGKELIDGIKIENRQREQEKCSKRNCVSLAPVFAIAIALSDIIRSCSHR